MLPATKAIPKELLNVYDRPALQFGIDEAIDLGAKRIIVVTHPDKSAIRDYLTARPDYIRDLRARGKELLGAALSEIEIPDGVEIVFVDQHEPLGLGHAILCAEGLTLPGPFGVILPDDLIMGRPCLSEMAEHYTEGHMIAAMEVRPEETGSYGIFCLARPSIGRSVPVSGMVEKPDSGLAPSRLAAVGRYVLDPGIFATLQHVKRGAGGEIQLTDAIARDADTVALTAFRFSGTRYDCGTHDGLLDAALARQRDVKRGLANIDLAASGMVECACHPDLSEADIGRRVIFQKLNGTTWADWALYKHEPRAVCFGAVSRKGHHMKWNEIEDKWAAMTKRIRADRQDNPQPVGGRRDVRPATGAGNLNTVKMPKETRSSDGIPLPKP